MLLSFLEYETQCQLYYTGPEDASPGQVLARHPFQDNLLVTDGSWDQHLLHLCNLL